MTQKTSFLASSVLTILLLLGIACPSPPLPPVPPGPAPATLDSGAPDTPLPAATAENACANLAALQCPEGLRADCISVTQKAIDLHTTDLKLGCLVAAKTVEAVRACGTVLCR
jgi:hypothetical protein